ncbi:SRPBCC family protein [Devosia nitrariae]|uniref:SRPBCC domain-containing protein n=1 Tax=Devosia nitrariae TaxID=2071872 RepID=A0ABQ5WBG0_9HYPH|nr:hypothetical protein [Devosia nitrariae]GLQ57089.1 hypothetical protein GCM10010862_43480 [Devosia nitrariae]
MSETEDDLQVLVETIIEAPVDAVWRALREREQLRNWFGWDAETLADEIDFIFFGHAKADEAGHVLQFGEWEGVSDAFELTGDANETTVAVVRRGPPVDWAGAFEDVPEGWVTFVQQLRLLLDRHPGAKRRTLYLSGAARAGVAEPRQALGIIDLIRRPDGAEYSASLPTGETISGIVWHRTHFQLGLNVTEWGDGLLVVTNTGVTDTRSSAGGSVLLTTFGLDDATFGELASRWRAWWEKRYEAPQAE